MSLVNTHNKTIFQLFPFVYDLFLDEIKDRILSAIEEIHNVSCVRWVEKKKETDWVRFVEHNRRYVYKNCFPIILSP